VTVCVSSDKLAIGSYELNGLYVVRSQSESANHPTDTASERITDDTDIRGGSCEVCQAVLASRGGEFVCKDSCLDTRAKGIRIDMHGSHAFCPYQQSSLMPHNRPGVVSSSVEGNPDRVVRGEADDHDHVRS
jgi:hypothetical protein